MGNQCYHHQGQDRQSKQIWDPQLEDLWDLFPLRPDTLNLLRTRQRIEQCRIRRIGNWTFP